MLCLVDGRELVGLALVAQDRNPDGDPLPDERDEPDEPDGGEPIPSRCWLGLLGLGLGLTTALGGLLLLLHVTILPIRIRAGRRAARPARRPG